MGSSEPIRAKMPQCPCADPEGGIGGPDPPLENHKL